MGHFPNFLKICFRHIIGIDQQSVRAALPHDLQKLVRFHIKEIIIGIQAHISKSRFRYHRGAFLIRDKEGQFDAAPAHCLRDGQTAHHVADADIVVCINSDIKLRHSKLSSFFCPFPYKILYFICASSKSSELSISCTFVSGRISGMQEAGTTVFSARKAFVLTR